MRMVPVEGELVLAPRCSSKNFQLLDRWIAREQKRNSSDQRRREAAALELYLAGWTLDAITQLLGWKHHGCTSRAISVAKERFERFLAEGCSSPAESLESLAPAVINLEGLVRTEIWSEVADLFRHPGPDNAFTRKHKPHEVFSAVIQSLLFRRSLRLSSGGALNSRMHFFRWITTGAFDAAWSTIQRHVPELSQVAWRDLVDRQAKLPDSPPPSISPVA